MKKALSKERYSMPSIELNIALMIIFLVGKKSIVKACKELVETFCC